MLNLADKKQKSSVNFAQVVFLSVSNLISSNGFTVSDMNEILSFPRIFSYENADYVKLANIKININRETFK